MLLSGYHRLPDNNVADSSVHYRLLGLRPLNTQHSTAVERRLVSAIGAIHVESTHCDLAEYLLGDYHIEFKMQGSIYWRGWGVWV